MALSGKMALSPSYSFSYLPTWGSKHGIVFDVAKVEGLTTNRRFTEGCVEKRRLFRGISKLPDDLTYLQICDGTFDGNGKFDLWRWLKSVGAEVAFPQSESQFDEAIDLLLWWSEIRRRPYLRWLSLKPNFDIARILDELPHVVQPDSAHWEDGTHEVNDEAKEFLGTLAGRSHVHPGIVLFESPVDAAMFKLAYG